MNAALITLAYRPELSGFDDGPLRELLDGDLLAKESTTEVSEYFFEVDGVPHLACFVKWRTAGAESASEKRAASSPEPAASAPAQRSSVARRDRAGGTKLRGRSAAANSSPARATARRKPAERAPRGSVDEPKGDGGAPRERSDPRDGLNADQKNVFERLRAWRMGKAQAAGVPAFRVLTNRQLAALAKRPPGDLEQLRKVPGFGAVRTASYGEELLSLLAGLRAVAESSAGVLARATG